MHINALHSILNTSNINYQYILKSLSNSKKYITLPSFPITGFVALSFAATMIDSSLIRWSVRILSPMLGIIIYKQMTAPDTQDQEKDTNIEISNEQEELGIGQKEPEYKSQSLSSRVTITTLADFGLVSPIKPKENQFIPPSPTGQDGQVNPIKKISSSDIIIKLRSLGLASPEDQEDSTSHQEKVSHSEGSQTPTPKNKKFSSKKALEFLDS